MGLRMQGDGRVERRGDEGCWLVEGAGGGVGSGERREAG